MCFFSNKSLEPIPEHRMKRKFELVQLSEILLIHQENDELNGKKHESVGSSSNHFRRESNLSGK